MEQFYVSYMIPFKNYIMMNCLGGPRPIQFRYLINFQKCSTFLVVLALMNYYNNWSWTAHIYLANHGVYGIIWLLKEFTIPDNAWKAYLTIPSSILVLTALVLYWGAGYIVVAHRVETTPTIACICIMLNTLGTALMLSTDTQKFYTLKFKKGLISDGWLTWSRNTNYLGEMMLYFSFGLLANHWFPYMWLLMIWSLLFLSNMVSKEISIRKKEGGEAYIKRSGFLIPNVSGWLSGFFQLDPKIAKGS